MNDIDPFKRKLTAFTLVAGLAVAGCANDGADDAYADPVETAEEAPAQVTDEEQMALSDLDEDGDSQISESEFQRYAQEHRVFDEWDEDGDGMLQQEEFGAIGFEQSIGDYDAWDRDGDGALGSDELYGSVFNTFDEDGDGFLSTNELDDVGESGFFDV